MRPRLRPDEGDRDRQPQRDEAADLRIGPFAELLVGEADEDGHQGSHQQRGAQVVDVPVGVAGDARGQRPPDDDQHDQADGNVDEEDPVPADGIGQDPADGRTDERAHPEDRAEIALVLAALGRREDVADDGQRDREQRAGAQPLQPAEGEELPHLLADAAQQRADEEDADADDEDRPPAEDVGQLAVQRPRDGGRQQVRGEGPDVDAVAAQVADDDRQRGADDRLVEGREEDAEQHRAQDLHPDVVWQLDGRAVVGARLCSHWESLRKM